MGTSICFHSQGGGNMEPMYLNDIEAYESSDVRGDAIRQMKATGLPVPQIQHLFAFKPDRTIYLERFTQVVMHGQSALSSGQRELVAAFTSRLNECPF
jgi:hypothetical protein